MAPGEGLGDLGLKIISIPRRTVAAEGQPVLLFNAGDSPRQGADLSFHELYTVVTTGRGENMERLHQSASYRGSHQLFRVRIEAFGMFPQGGKGGFYLFFPRSAVPSGSGGDHMGRVMLQVRGYRNIKVKGDHICRATPFTPVLFRSDGLISSGRHEVFNYDADSFFILVYPPGNDKRNLSVNIVIARTVMIGKDDGLQ